MNPARKRKLAIVLFVLGVLTTVTLLILYALRQNISLFYTPQQLSRENVPQQRHIRLGGMVVPGSIQRGQADLSIRFDVTDYKKTIHVVYQGILPDLFREGQGVVVQGQFNQKRQQLNATEILAKHDEKYMPPEVKNALGPIQKNPDGSFP
jgi:cytochrome c-type biogenesis protein CcmE